MERASRELVGRALRRERGRLPQTALADELKVTQAMISDWENGKKAPGVDQLRKLEGVLGLPAGHFLRAGGYVDDPCERDVEAAIRADPILGPAFKENLVAAYRAFRQAAVEGSTP